MSNTLLAIAYICLLMTDQERQEMLKEAKRLSEACDQEAQSQNPA